jgi:hypothetical protein
VGPVMAWAHSTVVPMTTAIAVDTRERRRSDMKHLLTVPGRFARDRFLLLIEAVDAGRTCVDPAVMAVGAKRPTRRGAINRNAQNGMVSLLHQVMRRRPRVQLNPDRQTRRTGAGRLT